MGFKEFFFVDAKDIWNWILLAIALPLLYWGVTSIIRALSVQG